MMIKRLIFLSLLMCTSFLGGRAQGHSSNSASESIQGLYQSAEQCITNGNHRQGRMLLRIAINLADMVKDTELKQNCANLIGTSFCAEAAQLLPKQDLKGCEALLDSAIAVFDAFGLNEACMSVWEFKPTIRQQYGTFETCEALYRQAYGYAQKHGFEEKQVTLLKGLGLLQRQSGHEVEAAKTFLTIDSIGKKSPSHEVQIEARIAIGEDAQSRNLWVYALGLYNEVFDIVNNQEEKRTKREVEQMKTTCGLMRNVVREMKLYDKALWLTGQIFILAKELAAQMSPDDGAAFMAKEKREYYLTSSYDHAQMKDREKSLCYLDSARAMLPANATVMDQTEMSYNTLFPLYALQDWNRLLEAIKATEPYITPQTLTNAYVQIQQMKSEALIGLGRFEEAMAPASFYAQWCKEQKGDESPEYVKALLDLSQATESVGQLNAAAEQLGTAFKSLHRFLKRKLPFMSREERGKVMKMVQFVANQTARINLKMSIQPGHAPALHDFSRLAFNAQLMQNGLLLNAESQTMALIKKHGTEKDARDYRYLQGVNEDYNAIIAGLRKHQSQTGNSYSAEDNEVFMMANHEAWYNDLSLSQRFAAFPDLSRFLDDDFQAVANALHEGEVLVCMTSLQGRTEAELQPQYGAYVLRKGDAWPTLVSICKQATLDSLVRKAGNSPQELYTGETALQLSDAVLTPLLRHLKEGERVYWQPAGAFHQLAVGAWPLPGKKGKQGSKLFGDAFELVQISSPRTLLLPEEKALPHPRATVYGGLTYDMTEQEMLAESQKYDWKDASDADKRGASRVVDRFHSMRGTLLEADTVAQLLRKQLGTDTLAVKEYRGKAGTQESFEAMSGAAPEILHMATHGFCFQPQDTNKPDGLQFYTNAMTLSGLVLSGENAGWKGDILPLGVRSGLLTAEAIAQLDLSGMRLASLAACDTGLGTPTPEGVYGLMRAFKKSKVRHLVMSLWEASDRATLLFMTEFYRNLDFQAPDWRIRQAFKKAQTKVRHEMPDPYYWACFVLVD